MQFFLPDKRGAYREKANWFVFCFQIIWRKE